MIKEFDLDAPQEPKPARARFRSETRCVTSLFERCYQNTNPTGRFWKLLVEVVATGERTRSVDLLGVVVVQVTRDLDAFLSLPEAEKLEMSLTLLMEGVAKLASEQHWDRAPFEVAAAAVRERRFMNEWVWGKRSRNRARSLSAEVLVSQRISEAEIAVRFFDAVGRELNVVSLVREQPDEFIFFDHLGSFRWTDDATVELVSRDARRTLVARATPST